jgi:hypothetical protein
MRELTPLPLISSPSISDSKMTPDGKTLRPNQSPDVSSTDYTSKVASGTMRSMSSPSPTPRSSSWTSLCCTWCQSRREPNHRQAFTSVQFIRCSVEQERYQPRVTRPISSCGLKSHLLHLNKISGSKRELLHSVR